MSIEHKEIAEIRDRQLALEVSVEHLANSIKELPENISDFALAVRDLTYEIKEDRLKNEYRDKDLAILKTGYEEMKPVVDKARETQENRKKFWDGALGNWGKIFSGVVVAIVALYFFPNAIEIIKGK